MKWINAKFKSSMFPNSLKLAAVTHLNKKDEKIKKKTMEQFTDF